MSEPTQDIAALARSHKEGEVLVQMSRSGLERAAMAFMIQIYGKPSEMTDQEHKDRFYGRYGFLCSFIVDVTVE